MSSGQRRASFPFNATQIKDGKIVRLRKDGTVKAVLDDYKPNHPNKDVSNKK